MTLTIYSLLGIPEVELHDHLPRLLLDALERTGLALTAGDVLVVTHKIGSKAAPGTAVLLPHDPDSSAHGIRMAVKAATGVDVPVIISDTFGRPWRRGLTDIAIGISGMAAILDLKGTRDAAGRELHVTEVAVADEIAAAADLVMGKATSTPAALVRGVEFPKGEGRATDLVRPAGEGGFP